MIGECIYFVKHVLDEKGKDTLIPGLLLNEKLNKIHRVIDIKTGETPAGTECDVFITACGEEIEGWAFGGRGHPGPITTSRETAEKIGLPFCEICF